jgi:hypothetical protein
MRIPYRISGALLLLTALAGCRKYEDLAPIENAAYLRVYNSIQFELDPFDKGGDAVQPFLTFLFDPVMDEKETPSGGAIVGDFLASRQSFSVSYPINANTASDAGGVPYPSNYDYPGNAHVRTAPVINGFNLSAWAQVPSGKHRIVFMARPFSQTPFDQLSAATRGKRFKIIDTLVDLQPGEVYTMEAVCTDLIKKRYSLYMRQETFTKQQFLSDKLYVSFYNFTAIHPAPTTNYADPYAVFFRDSVQLSYTYTIPLNPQPGPGELKDIYCTTIYNKWALSAPFIALPMVDRAYFFDKQGYLGDYAPYPGGGGSLPYITFNTRTPGNSIPDGGFNCWGNPSTVNNTTNTFSGPGMPNLEQIITTNGKVEILPTVNIIEMINNRAYLIQIQRAISAK